MARTSSRAAATVVTNPGATTMRLVALLFLTLSLSNAEDFLGISRADLCKAEPHLDACRERPSSSSSRSKDDEDDPFSNIVTRAPISEHRQTKHRHHFKSLRDYYRYKEMQRIQEANAKQSGQIYSIYPIMRRKDQTYCSAMRGQFAFTCQPSKPLRIDLVEFCKDYSAFCGVPNFHRLPGPRMGPPPDATGIGHVGVSGKFGFGVGAVPGLEVGVGWGVDVGPIPGMGESVGVDLGLDLGIMGSKTPLAYRRGQDDPNQKGGGIVGVSGGVGVKAPGSGPIGVGSGVGVGR